MDGKKKCFFQPKQQQKKSSSKEGRKKESVNQMKKKKWFQLWVDTLFSKTNLRSFFPLCSPPTFETLFLSRLAHVCYVWLKRVPKRSLRLLNSALGRKKQVWGNDLFEMKKRKRNFYDVIFTTFKFFPRCRKKKTSSILSRAKRIIEHSFGVLFPLKNFKSEHFCFIHQNSFIFGSASV